MARVGTTKYESNKQEKKVAKEVGGKVVIASGSLWFASSDVKNKDLLIECKTTEKAFYPLHIQNTWLKIEKEAIRDNLRTPVMCIDLHNGKERVAVFKDSDFSHYKMYDQFIENCTKFGDGNKSTRITFVEQIINMIQYRRTLVVITWDHFLEMIDEGVQDEN